MASRPIVPQQQRGGAVAAGKQKPAVDGNNRKALGDIGNLVNPRAAAEGKPQQQITRPITRSFGAQLLANAQAAAAAAQKKKVTVIGDGVVVGKGGVAKVVPKQRAVTVKPKPETVIEISPDTEDQESNEKSVKQRSSKNRSSRKVQTLTSILTARSKAACGLTEKEQIHNIDATDAEDQLAVTDYVEDIYKFYRLAENSSRVHDYMDSQTEINEKMRAILADWLIEVHNKFDLMPETLYLTLHIVDRYLSMKTVPRRELQLVGITAMLISCKYEEIWALERADTGYGESNVEQARMELNYPHALRIPCAFSQGSYFRWGDGTYGLLFCQVGFNAVLHDHVLPIHGSRFGSLCSSMHSQ